MDIYPDVAFKDGLLDRTNILARVLKSISTFALKKADGVIAINRVKPHTHAKGGFNESGIVKMLSIGLGNLRGCQSLHAYGFPRLSHRISQAAKLIIEKTPIMLVSPRLKMPTITLP